MLSDSLIRLKEGAEEDEVNSTKGPQYSVSSRRWAMVLVYGLLNMSNSMMWCTFSPISDLTEDFFEHTGGSTALNMFTAVYYALYLPGTILGALAIKTHDIRGGLLR